MCPEKVSSHVAQALLILKRTNRINNFEFLITYCYLFNGISLMMLKDRILRKVLNKYTFGSKQHIHQNIITKVINLMKEEIEKIHKAEKISETRN